MGTYLVSICIPTFNRSKLLKQCIESLIKQKEFQEGLVEIIISDNASTDCTEEMGEAYAQKYSQIKYYRNQENLKDVNFPLALSRASGKLRKLSQDTLVFNSCALKLFCDAAKFYAASQPLLFWNNGHYSRIKGDHCISVEGLDQFLNIVSFEETWIGGFSIWDTECATLCKTFDRSESHLWQVWNICSRLEENPVAIIFNDVFARIQDVPRKDLSYGIFQVFYKNYFNILGEFKAKGLIQSKTWEYLEKDMLYRFLLYHLIQWEIAQSLFKYGDESNLKQEIFENYQGKDYFSDFLRKYNRSLKKQKTKKLIKSIPGIQEIYMLYKRVRR